ncbi:membrane-spanning 4-domains subfamily A member 15-like isoform X4 [Epinephelus fuscoguttatus]|uniref:membrane-spanning 4-domains subfamily A member 15-like isoform X4 n=1 Tax=Epinephelus fuscoguttatus TaxID=293821 RepID=UPI0020D06055|nr:membrane-spanning 4-domains subfamily A member 15-like isoform X4 [Epinephelus fuscoguttatus]
MINTQLSYEAAAHSSYSQFTSNIMASSPVVTTAGSVVVVTRVIPAPQVAAAQNAARKNKLRRGHVVALGTAQIMIGLMVFLFELAMIPCTDTLGIVSGVFVWRPLCSVLSGSLTVAAEEFNNCAVKGALGFIVVSVVTSAGAMVIYLLDAFQFPVDHVLHYCSFDNYNNSYEHWIRTTAVSGVLAGVSVLEFIISICVFVFVYDASRQSMDQQPTVITNQSHEAATQTLTLPTYEPPPVSQPPTTIPERSYETTRPLEYDMSIPTPPPDPASFVAFKLF